MDFYIDKDTLVIRVSGPAGYECSFEGQDNAVKVTANVHQLKAKAIRGEDGSISIIENPDLSRLFEDLRNKRNQLLKDCDWTQNRDCSLSTDKQDAWAAYRKALRDLPASTQDPTQVVWPTPPS